MWFAREKREKRKEKRERKKLKRKRKPKELEDNLRRKVGKGERKDGQNEGKKMNEKRGEGDSRALKKSTNIFFLFLELRNQEQTTRKRNIVEGKRILSF